MASVLIDHLPGSIEEFTALRNRIAVTPEGGAAMLVAALLLYAENRELGQQCLTVAVDSSSLQDGPHGYKGRQLLTKDLQRVELQVRGKEYLPRSYIQGATPANGYTLPALPYTVVCSDNAYSGDRQGDSYKVFVSSSGAASPRPVTLRRNDKGFWKATEWSSLVVGVQPPARRVADDL